MAVKTFTTGEVLTAADTNTYLANAGLDYIKTQTITGSPSSVTVSSAFSSTWDHYRIAVNNVQITSGNAFIRIQLGSSGNHRWSLNYCAFNATFANLNGTSQTTWQYLNGTTDNHSFVFDIFGPNIAKHTRSSVINYIDSGAVGTCVAMVEDTTQYTAFTLSCSASTMASGSITVYGYRKA